MRSRNPLAHRAAPLAALLAVLAACDPDPEVIVAEYSSERDDAAMAAIASAWSEPAGLEITLCEDVARSATWTGPDGCVVDHVVRGGGLGLDHVVEHEVGAGIGGCPYRAEAWVVGTIAGPGLSGEVPVTGTVEVGSSFDDDPYAFPYTLLLSCDGAVQVCSVRGALDAAGSVAATLVIGPTGPGQAETSHALARVGAATCP